MKAIISDRLRAWFLSTVVTGLTRPPAITLTNRLVPGPEVIHVPTRHGPVRCFVTRPPEGSRQATELPPPVHINYHGGAFLVGAPQQDEHLIRFIAGEVGSVVVNVDYSRAPKVRFPHAHEECFDVLRWVADAGGERQWDGNRVTISGTSAGGNLALGALELARREGGLRVCAAVLIVPAVDVSAPLSDYVSDIPKPFVGPSLVRTMLTAYFPDEAQRSDPLASPTLADEGLAALPPLLIMSGQHDSLRRQQERFVEKARRSGGTVTYECFPGVDHNFNLDPRTPAAIWDRFKERIQTHLRTHL